MAEKGDTMKEFTYVEPLTLAEAIDFLAEHGDESKVLGEGAHSYSC